MFPALHLAKILMLVFFRYCWDEIFENSKWYSVLNFVVWKSGATCKEDDNVRRRSKYPWVTDPICYWGCGCFRRGSVTSGMAGVCLTSLTALAASWPDMWRNSALIPQFPPIVSPRRLTFTWWGCCGLCFWHKSTELAHSFLFCSCVSFCLYGLFNCFSVQEFSL